MKHHFARHADTDRATELDPATFDHAEDWQRERANGIDWFNVFVWGGMVASGIGFWWLVAKAVL